MSEGGKGKKKKKKREASEGGVERLDGSYCMYVVGWIL